MKILLLGKTGQVGWELQRSLAPLGEIEAHGSATADLSRPQELVGFLRSRRFDAVVNAAAYTAVDRAESEPDVARHVNAEAVSVIAQEARRQGAWVVHYSTDYVFNGWKDGAYVEDDPTDPLSVYGSTKLAGEQALREHQPRHLIFRTSWVYAVRGGNFPKTMLRLARERDALRIVADQHGAPTSAELLADVTALALHRIFSVAQDANLAGTYHLTASGVTTWFEYAREVLKLAVENGAELRVTPDRVEAIATADYPVPARRPANSRLDTSKLTRAFGLTLPHWRFHLARAIDELIKAPS